MRFNPILLCSLLLLLSAASQADPTAAYLAARDRYIAKFDAHPTDDVSYMRSERAAVDDLERQTKKIIPPWRSPAFPANGRINITVLHHELGFGTLDGLLYDADGTKVIITTPALLQHWITDHNGWWSDSDNIPKSIEAAIRSEQFWTYAFGDDSGTFFFGEIPVKISSGKGVVLLATSTQTGIPDDGPKELLAAVLQDNRVVIARQDLATKIPQRTACRQVLWKPGRGEQTNREFQACFAPYLHEQPNYDAIRKQVQALADLLQ
jgi:hypothetical protein